MFHELILPVSQFILAATSNKCNDFAASLKISSQTINTATIAVYIKRQTAYASKKF